ncbi:sugar-non-specific nuclease NucA [Minicystis rosea]|nr:sugar-non-specific nuclease NucA [Minicystis rosea]
MAHTSDLATSASCYTSLVRRTVVRIALALGLATALTGSLGCGLDRLLGRDERGHSAEPGRRHRHKPETPPDEDARDKHERKKHRHPEEPPPVPASPAPTPEGTTSIHLALGAPTDADPTDDWLVIKPQYALSYNPKRLGANWVSWELNASYFGGEPRHKGKFIVDDSLPPEFYRVHHEDYSNSDYDRGHMVRSEERTRSRADNNATFLMTNILPQRHDLNAGPWLRLEEHCQSLAQNDRKEMFITAGPIYGTNPETIGHGVAVPESFFKIVVVLDRGQGPADVSAATRVIAVIMPNVMGIMDQPWWRYRTSVAEIERRTGYHFLGRVPEDVRRTLEAKVDRGPTQSLE